MKFIPVWKPDGKIAYVAESIVRLAAVNPDNTLRLVVEMPIGADYHASQRVYDTVKGGIIADGLQNVRPTYNTMLVSNKEVKERLAKNGNG